MNYASVCSGVEAASLAWHSLGWNPVWFSEIEPFPAAVLHHRFRASRPINQPLPTDIPISEVEWEKIKVLKNEHGRDWLTECDADLGRRYTEFKRREAAIELNSALPIDGKIQNLGDMTKIEGEKYRGTVDLLVGGTPCQGFSVAGKQGGLDDPRSALCLKYIDLLKTIQPRWFVWENVPGVFSTNGGSDFTRFISEIENIGYGVAWRVLDAQYVRTYQFQHAVPQRRRRVFVVGYFGDWRPAAEVLFESNGVFGNPPPRRIKGQGVAGGFETGAGKSILSDIAGILDCSCKDGPIRNQNGAGVICSQYGDIAGSLTARHDSSPCADRGQNVICVHGSQDPICNTEHANAVNRNQGIENCVCYGIGNGQVNTAVSMTKEVSQTLDIMHDKQAVLCYENHPADSRIKDCGDTSPTIPSRAGTGGGNLPLVQSIMTKQQSLNIGDDIANSLGANDYKEPQGVAYNSTVRRLTPLECERLMCFPDNWTRIPWGKKPPEDCPDSPRYKACGNSMCVNVMQWIGTRIQRVENIIKEASK